MADDEQDRHAWERPGAFEVADGVHRIPLPLPGDGLKAVNVYAIEQPDGVVLVDSGWALGGAQEQLEQGLAAIDRDLGQVTRVLVTHVHRDHYELGLPLRRLSLGLRLLELADPVADALIGEEHHGFELCACLGRCVVVLEPLFGDVDLHRLHGVVHGLQNGGYGLRGGLEFLVRALEQEQEAGRDVHAFRERFVSQERGIAPREDGFEAEVHGHGERVGAQEKAREGAEQDDGARSRQHDSGESRQH